MEFTNFENEQSNSQNIMATILKSLPKESGLTKIEYEGPSIALYSKNHKYGQYNYKESNNKNR